MVVIAGDLTEEKDHHSAKLVNKIVDHIHELAEITPVIIDQGNHDYKEEGSAFFEFLNRIPRVRWIAEPSVINGVLILPHSNDPKRDWQNIALSEYKHIVCHQTFNGANVGFGRGLDGIPLDILPKKSIVFSGDVHVPQEMGPVVYIGAPYHVDFGDDYQARLIWMQGQRWDSVDVSMYPQKRAIHIDADGNPKPAVFNTGDVLKITVDVESLEGWPQVRDDIRANYEEQEAIVWQIIPRVIRKAQNKHKKVRAHVSDHDTLDAFAGRMRIRESLIKTGHKLLEQTSPKKR